MKKANYLNDPAVRKFAAWLGANLDNGTLAHGWLDRRSGAAWRCTSTIDAFRQYAWAFPTLPTHHIVGGSSFAASAAALGALKAALHGAVSDQQARHAATGVVLWGGVGAGNVRWLDANVAGLLAMLQAIAKALAANDLKNPLLMARGLRFNAGMTKVYSLVVPGMIIYDSRVAAALAWVVTRYCVASGLPTVPPRTGLSGGARQAGSGHGQPQVPRSIERSTAVPGARFGAIARRLESQGQLGSRGSTSYRWYR